MNPVELPRGEFAQLFLYVITNKIDGKRYVGQTDNLDRRWKIHKASPRYVNTIKRRPTVLSFAMAKHGIENFVFEPLMSLDTQAETDAVEKFLIKNLGTHVPNGYNVAPGGLGGRGSWTDEAKKIFGKRRSGAGNPMFGRTTSLETSEKLSLSNKRRWASEEKRKEHAEKIRRAWERKRSHAS